MTEHLDLDALADVLAGEPAPAHLAGCAQCTTELAELRAAEDQVRAALRSLEEPPLPAGLADRLSAALAQEPPLATASRASTGGTAGTVTTLPATRPRRAARWLPAAAAAVLLLGGAAFGISQLTGSGGSDESSTSAAGGAATDLALVRNSTGADYTGRSDLAAAVPRLLAGTSGQQLAAPAPQAADGAAGTAESDSSKASGSTAAQLPAAPMRAAAADALAPLRTDAGLAECLAALLPTDDPSVQPLALDYGTFKGQPAMVVVLPSTSPKSFDVFVVGPGCSRANDSVLFYASVPAS